MQTRSKRQTHRRNKGQGIWILRKYYKSEEVKSLGGRAKVVVGSPIQRTNSRPIKSRCANFSVLHTQERELAKVPKSQSNLRLSITRRWIWTTRSKGIRGEESWTPEEYVRGFSVESWYSQTLKTWSEFGLPYPEGHVATYRGLWENLCESF